MPMGIAGVNYGGAAVGPRKRVTYTIVTMTGDLPGAGTSAGVALCRRGECKCVRADRVRPRAAWAV